MKTIAAAVLCLAVAAGAVFAEEAGKAPQRIPLQYEMAVGADGKAIRLTPDRELPEAVDQWIRQRVSAYTFQPATVGGQPQPATTTLYLTLAPGPGADGATGYRIETLSTGPKLVRGRYESQPRGVGAAYFIVEYDADGRTTKASIDDREASVGGPSFRRWGLALARSFRFKPETVAGQGVPGRGRVPIVYCVEDDCPALLPSRLEDGANLGGEMAARSVLTAVPPAGS